MSSTFQVTTSQLAEILGEVGARRIQQLVHVGLPRVEHGVFDLRTAVGWYIERLKERAEGQEGQDLKAARKRLYQEQTRKYRLENDRNCGELIHADDLSNLVTTLCGLFANQLEAMPARLGLLLAAESQPERVQAVIRDECTAIRNEVADAYEEWLGRQKWSSAPRPGTE